MALICLIMNHLLARIERRRYATTAREPVKFYKLSCTRVDSLVYPFQRLIERTRRSHCFVADGFMRNHSSQIGS